MNRRAVFLAGLAMPERTKSTVTPRISRPPRWGFLKGLLTGAVIEVPAIALGVWLLARMGIGNRAESFMRILRLSAVFAGAPALLTAGGIGRRAAHGSVERPGGRRHAIRVAARAHAAGGAALVLIAVIPHGNLPGHSWHWIVPLAMGAVIGAACGAVIGLVCGGAAPLGIADVIALARVPSGALRHLIDPDDLMKLGAAVVERTTRMFDRMFEPAQRPPTEAEPTAPHPPPEPPKDGA